MATMEAITGELAKYAKHEDVLAHVAKELEEYTKSKEILEHVSEVQRDLKQDSTNTNDAMIKVGDNSEEKMKDEMTRICNEKNNELETKVMEKIAMIELKLNGSKDSHDKDQKSKHESRGLTIKGNLGFLSKYSGKHEEYDDWKFKMRTFLSEEVEFKEPMSLLDDLTEMPL